MKPEFNERKATEIAYFFLSELGGEAQLYNLLKLIYLADRKSLIESGRPMTFDKMYAMDKGPVPSRSYNVIDEGRGDGTWDEYMESGEEHEVRITSEMNRQEVSEYELGLLEEVMDELDEVSWKELYKKTHDLPEFEGKDPNGSRIKITYKEILEESSADIDPEEVEEELRSLASFQELV